MRWTIAALILAAAVTSAPMTFVGKNGRQYLVVGISGRQDSDSALIAFALPQPGDPQLDLKPAPPVQRGALNASAGVPVALRAEDLLPVGNGVSTRRQRHGRQDKRREQDTHIGHGIPSLLAPALAL